MKENNPPGTKPNFLGRIFVLIASLLSFFIYTIVCVYNKRWILPGFLLEKPKEKLKVSDSEKVGPMSAASIRRDGNDVYVQSRSKISFMQLNLSGNYHLFHNAYVPTQSGSDEHGRNLSCDQMDEEVFWTLRYSLKDMDKDALNEFYKDLSAVSMSKYKLSGGAPAFDRKFAIREAYGFFGRVNGEQMLLSVYMSQDCEFFKKTKLGEVLKGLANETYRERPMRPVG